MATESVLIFDIRSSREVLVPIDSTTRRPNFDATFGLSTWHTHGYTIPGEKKREPMTLVGLLDKYSRDLARSRSRSVYVQLKEIMKDLVQGDAYNFALAMCSRIMTLGQKLEKAANDHNSSLFAIHLREGDVQDLRSNWEDNVVALLFQDEREELDYNAQADMSGAVTRDEQEVRRFVQEGRGRFIGKRAVLSDYVRLAQTANFSSLDTYVEVTKKLQVEYRGPSSYYESRTLGDQDAEPEYNFFDDFFVEWMVNPVHYDCHGKKLPLNNLRMITGWGSYEDDQGVVHKVVRGVVTEDWISARAPGAPWLDKTRAVPLLGRDPKNNFGIRVDRRNQIGSSGTPTARYLCCDQPINTPGCWIGRVSVENPQPVLYDWMGRLDPLAAAAAVAGGVVLRQEDIVLQGTAWMDVEKYYKIDREIRDLVKKNMARLQGLWAVAGVGPGPARGVSRVGLNIPAFWITRMSHELANDLAEIFTLQSEYNEAQCPADNKVAVTRAGWVNLISREVFRLDEPVDQVLIMAGANSSAPFDAESIRSIELTSTTGERPAPGPAPVPVPVPAQADLLFDQAVQVAGAQAALANQAAQEAAQALQNARIAQDAPALAQAIQDAQDAADRANAAFLATTQAVQDARDAGIGQDAAWVQARAAALLLLGQLDQQATQDAQDAQASAQAATQVQLGAVPPPVAQVQNLYIDSANFDECIDTFNNQDLVGGAGKIGSIRELEDSIAVLNSECVIRVYNLFAGNGFFKPARGAPVPEIPIDQIYDDADPNKLSKAQFDFITPFAKACGAFVDKNFGGNQAQWVVCSELVPVLLGTGGRGRALRNALNVARGDATLPIINIKRTALNAFRFWGLFLEVLKLVVDQSTVENAQFNLGSPDNSWADVFFTEPMRLAVINFLNKQYPDLEGVDLQNTGLYPRRMLNVAVENRTSRDLQLDFRGKTGFGPTDPNNGLWGSGGGIVNLESEIAGGDEIGLQMDVNDFKSKVNLLEQINSGKGEVLTYKTTGAAPSAPGAPFSLPDYYFLDTKVWVDLLKPIQDEYFVLKADNAKGTILTQAINDNMAVDLGLLHQGGGPIRKISATYMYGKVLYVREDDANGVPVQTDPIKVRLLLRAWAATGRIIYAIDKGDSPDQEDIDLASADWRNDPDLPVAQYDQYNLIATEAVQPDFFRDLTSWEIQDKTPEEKKKGNEKKKLTKGKSTTKNSVGGNGWEEWE